MRIESSAVWILDGVWSAFHSTLMKVIIGISIGAIGAKIAGYRKRKKEEKEIDSGKQFQQLEFVSVHVATGADAKPRLICRQIGSMPISSVGKEAAQKHLLGLTADSAADETKSVIPMHGKLGSFVLRELHAHCKTYLRETGAALEWWIMVPVLETYKPLPYQAPTVLLVRLSDIHHFKNFASCRDILVHHGSDAGKILTLLELYRVFEAQQRDMATARAEGSSTQFREVVWLLDLKIPTDFLEPETELVKSGALKPYRTAPWERFAETLTLLGLSTD